MTGTLDLAAGLPYGMERRYLGERPRVAHALRINAGRGFVARCGVAPGWWVSDGWRGTGSQSEYETAAALPLCRRCERLIKS